MDVNPSRIVHDIGEQLLAEPRPNKDFIVKCLRKATDALSEIEQSASLKTILSPFTTSLVKRELFHHKDKDVKLLLSTCLIEIIRVLAPEPLFKDNILRDIFKLIFGIFTDLADTKSPYFSRRVKILETFAELKFSLQMLDIGCDNLVLEMFNIFFSVVREQHPQSLICAILSIMTQILKEEASQSLMEIIFRNILKEGKGERSASSSLAVAIIKSSSKELEPLIHCFLSSCILYRDAVTSELKDFYHELIFEIFQADPHMLLSIIPGLTQELLVDQVDTRIKAVNLIGKLFALPNSNFMHEYRPLFVEFLKRFFDKSTEVRLNVLQCAKACYLSNPSGPHSVEVLTAIEGRLVDFDDRVRAQAVTIVCHLTRSNLKNIPRDLISRAVERLRDKKISVRKNAMPKLLEVYRNYCILCSEGHMGMVSHFEQIPCRILMLSYDKDCTEFRPQNLEAVLSEDLFPISLSVEERTRHWIYLFSLFNSSHIKALNSILSQKQRLQKEMKNYVDLREKLKINNSEDVQKKIEASLLKMSAFFPDSNSAVESFRKLNQIKENTIFVSLGQFIEGLSITDAHNFKNSFVKSLGDRHPQLEFLRVLSRKLCYNIFNSDHIRCIIDGICGGDFQIKNFEEHSFNILKAVINFFPSLLRGSEKNFEELLLDENNPYSECLVQILAKAGPYISTNVGEVYPFLEKICLEGTRSKAKYAVTAMASLPDSQESVFPQLFKKLLDCLPSGRCIPTLLQSLGCVAQHSSLRLKFGPKEFLEYMEDVSFRENHGRNSDDMSSVGDSDCSISLKTKVFAIKAVVNSFLPIHENSNEEGFSELLEFLLNILQNDSFLYVDPGNSESTCLKLAAAKAVLRLSRRWDFHIHPEVFRCTIMVAKHEDPGIRKSFLEKLHSFSRQRVLPVRYACAFSFAPLDRTGPQDYSLKYMVEFIRDGCGGDQTLRDFVKQGGSVTDTPVYLLVYLVHVLAHDPSFPPENYTDVDTCFRFLRPLWFAVSCLLDAGSVAGNAVQVEDFLSFSLLFFHAIKKAEDAVDSHYTFRLHFLADIGISLLHALGRNKGVLVRPQGAVLLPSSFYRIGLADFSDEALPGNTAECPAREEFIKDVVKLMEVEVSQLDRGSKEATLPRKEQNNLRRQLAADKASAPIKGGGGRNVNGSSVNARVVSKSSVLNQVDGNSKLGREKIRAPFGSKRNMKKGRDLESEEDWSDSALRGTQNRRVLAFNGKGSFSSGTAPSSKRGGDKGMSVSSDTTLSEIINLTDDVIARRTRQRLKV